MQGRHSSTADRQNCNLLISLQALQFAEYVELTDAEPDEPAEKAPRRKGKGKQVQADCPTCGGPVWTAQRRYVNGVEYCNKHGLQ